MTPSPDNRRSPGALAMTRPAQRALPGIATPRLFPVLGEDEQRALVDDIRGRGVLVPVLVTPGGDTLDGHAREAAVAALLAEGIEVECPIRVVQISSFDEAAEVQIAANCHRRHLSAAQRDEIIARLADMAWSSRRIAAALHLDQSTVVRSAGWSGDACASRSGAEVIGLDRKRYARRRSSGGSAGAPDPRRHALRELLVLEREVDDPTAFPAVLAEALDEALGHDAAARMRWADHLADAAGALRRLGTDTGAEMGGCRETPAVFGEREIGEHSKPLEGERRSAAVPDGARGRGLTR